MAWFCFNDAFVSVVQSDRDPVVLMVRARKREHLRTLFGSNAKILTSDTNDYRYRVFTDHKSWADIVSKRIHDINYSNFKNSVKDDKLHSLYADFWLLHYQYGNSKERKV